MGESSQLETLPEAEILKLLEIEHIEKSSYVNFEVSGEKKLSFEIAFN